MRGLQKKTLSRKTADDQKRSLSRPHVQIQKKPLLKRSDQEQRKPQIPKQPLFVKRKVQIERQSFRKKSTEEQNSKQSRATQLQKGFTIPQGALFNLQSKSIPVSIKDKRLAYDNIMKLENLVADKNSFTYEELIKDFSQLTKNDLKEQYGYFVDQSRTQVGKSMLENGLFYVIHAKINLKSTYLAKDMYLNALRHKYLPKVVQNKQALQNFIGHHQRKLAELQQQKRDQMRKKLRMQSHFMQIMQNPQIGESIVKKYVMTQQDRLNKIKQDQSYLIDFFQINDIYQNKMVQVSGVLDEIDGIYAILVIKPRNGKDKGKEVMAVGLIKKVQNYQHNKDKLKEIQTKYPNIFAYVDIQDFDSILFESNSQSSQQALQK